MRLTGRTQKVVFFDAGVFFGALLKGDKRHAEARPLVEAARNGELDACTTAAVLCEVYAALTWAGAQPPHDPAEAAESVRALVDSPSRIAVLSEDVGVVAATMDLAAKHGLTARRVHDAHHAAAALCHGVDGVYTYDLQDWRCFAADGLRIAGPLSVVAFPSAG
jgi:predicted nucleic acid-binding protein